MCTLHVPEVARAVRQRSAKTDRRLIQNPAYGSVVFHKKARFL